MRRKFLSVVLCVCMVLTMVPFAFAAGSDDTSTTNTQEQAPVANSSGSGSGGSTTSVSLPNNNTGDLPISTDNAVLDGSVDGSSKLTYTNGKISVTGNNVTIKNLTFGDGASLEVNADTFTLTGCTFNGSTYIRNPVSLNVSNATVTGNTFSGTESDDTPAYYNAIEFSLNSGHKLNSATLSNNTFTAAIENNYFSAYYFENNAKITVENNVIQSANKGSSAIRISNSAHATGVEFNLNNNTYEYGTTTDTPYEGFILLQDFAKTQESEPTQEFTTFKINITNLRAPNNAKQLLYVYDDQDGIITTNQPIVQGDDTISKFIVAKIGDNLYTSLKAAVSAASAGQTVTLLKDTKEGVTVSKNLTIDLGGKTLTGLDLTNRNGKNERLAFTANNGDVTLQNGNIDGRVNAYDAGSLTIAENVTVKNSYNNGDTYDCFGIVVWGDGTAGNENCKSPKLTVNGKVTLEKGGIAISTNGTDLSNATITINKGAVISSNEDGAIYLPSGKLIMNGGTISGPTGIQICAGSANINSEFQLNGGTVIATGDDQRTSKGTGDGLIPDGAAISVVNRGYPNGVPTVAINGGFFSSAKNDAVLAYNWSAGAASNWAEATSHVSITNGYFTSDPTSYLANDRYSVPSDKDGYTYMVSNTAPTTPSIFVKDQTETTVDEKITEANAAKINAVISKANVDGTAEAVSSSGKDAIVNSANVPTTDNNDKITIDVKVTVSATFANLTDDSSASTLTFTAIPVATVSVNGEQKAANISVPNDYLNGKAITVKLPLPEGFTPQQIKHTSTDGSVEYFLLTQKRGAKTFTIEDGCAVFTITKFSTFEVSGTQTYVEPSSGSSGGSGSTTYAVNVNAATNGAVAADKKTAAKGTTVTVTASPSKGYVVDGVKVVDKDGKDVAVTGKDGKYVFTMPGSAVTVTGSFKAETPVALPFTDVKSGDWFYPAVQYAYAQGLMTGTSATTFAPNGTMNRAMIVTVLYRLEKSPAVTGASKFTDVPAGQWYSDAVAWAAANKIVNGYDETTFGPMNAVTREQMAAILFRYEQVKGLENVTLEENLNRFPDQDKISAYAIPALQWAVGQKIINGNADGTLDPTGTATRAQVAQIFTNLLNK